MQITTPFYRKGGALGLIFKVRVFETWPIGVGRLPREGGMGRWSSRPPPPTLSFLPLSYRLAFSVRFFFFALYPTTELVHILHHLTTLVPKKRKICLARG